MPASHRLKRKKLCVYKCDTCGSMSDKPQMCCGQPMTKKIKRINIA